MRQLVGPAAFIFTMPALLQQRRPRRIRGIARRLDRLLVAPGDVNRVEGRPAVPAGVAKEHDHASIRRTGRTFIVITLGKNALAGTVGAHDTDGEPAFELFCKGDVVTPRRPNRRRIGAIAEANALRLATAR